METKDFLPYTQNTNTDPFTKSNETSPHHIILFRNNHCSIILIYVYIIQIIQFLRRCMELKKSQSIFFNFQTFYEVIFCDLIATGGRLCFINWTNW